MSVLRNLEEKLAGLVEGTFSRAFKSEVRPVEIARKLAREMEQHKVVSLSRTYVPNEYTVWLSPRDREQFSGYEDELREELSGYLLEHARRERLALLSRPEIDVQTDERLRLGEFGIQARLVRPDDDAGRAAPAEEGHTQVYSASEPDRRAAGRAQRPPAARAQLRLEGRRDPARLQRRGARALARLRRRDRRRERLAPPRRGPPVRRRLDRARPRLHQRRQGQRAAHRPAPQSLRPGDPIELGTSARDLRAES